VVNPGHEEPRGAAREAHAARFNYNLEAIYHDLKLQEQQSQRSMVSLLPKRYARKRAVSAKREVAVTHPTLR